ncbi:MAG TPA: EAL domain-containing protein [Rhizobiaceae bacterium]|nr:EAL domain-containing protein [Rhizobiaceae bacterium]
MKSLYGALLEMGTSTDWLVTANVILSILLGLWMLRYRALYFASRDEQENSKELIENLSEGIYRSLPDGRMLSANPALVKLNGYSSEAELLEGVKDIAREWYVEPQRRAEFREALMKDGRVEDFISEVFRHKSRERIWITEAARLVRDKKTGRPLFYEGSVREITETMKRLNLEERFRKLTNQLPGALFQLRRDADGRFTVLYLSQGFNRLTGLPDTVDATSEGRLDPLIHPDDRPGYYQSILASAETLEPWNYEFRITAHTGEERWLRINARADAAGDGSITWHGYTSDISGRKMHEMEIEGLAYFDPLTGLPNRRMFLNRMATAIAGCDSHKGHGALLFIDLDNFKTLNDTQGHDIGDAFLVKVAERLKTCLQDEDMVARIGGDEFVVVIDKAGADRGKATRRAITLANRILAELRTGFEVGVVRHVASASLGIVVFDGKDNSPDDILKHADIAMYQAKAAGRNGVALFDPSTLDREAERYRLINDLRHAFDHGELDLHYQLQVDDARIVIGAEALVRWNHPALGMVPPDIFVPLAEQFGMNDELTLFVCNRGLDTLAAWQRDPARAHLRLALNVSVQSFASDAFADKLKSMIETKGVDATKLTIELTERVMAKDHDQIAERMAVLKTFGIRLSLDDFGTGYSSLAYLKALPFDEVKIDGGFVTDLETTESDRALVRTILAMARTLGLTAVAEHVENIRQEAFLRAYGCDYLQGYLYGRPVPLARLFDQSVEAKPAAASDARKSA